MTFRDAQKLKSGDKVFWTDPDDGLCSRVVRVEAARVVGEFVYLKDEDGSELQAFPHELSFVN